MATRLNNADFSPLTVPGIGNSQYLIETTRRKVEEVLEMGRAFSSLFAALWYPLWHPLSRLQSIIDQANAMRTLTDMDDRMLADIGIRREQIPLIIAGRKTDSNVEQAVNRYFASL